MTNEQIEKLAKQAAKHIDDPDALEAFRKRLGIGPKEWMLIAPKMLDYVDP